MMTFKTENLKQMLKAVDDSFDQNNSSIASCISPNDSFHEKYSKFDKFVENQPIEIIPDPILNDYFSKKNSDFKLLQKFNSSFQENNDLSKNNSFFQIEQNRFTKKTNTENPKIITDLLFLNSTEETNNNFTKIHKQFEKIENSIWSEINYFEKEHTHNLSIQIDKFTNFIIQTSIKLFNFSNNFEIPTNQSLTNEQACNNLKIFFDKIFEELQNKTKSYPSKFTKLKFGQEDLIEQSLNINESRNTQKLDFKIENNYVFEFMPLKQILRINYFNSSLESPDINEPSEYLHQPLTDLKLTVIQSLGCFLFQQKSTSSENFSESFSNSNSKNPSNEKVASVINQNSSELGINISLPSNSSGWTGNPESALPLMNYRLANHVSESRIITLKNIIKHLKVENSALKSAKTMLESHFSSSKIKINEQNEEAGNV